MNDNATSKTAQLIEHLFAILRLGYRTYEMHNLANKIATSNEITELDKAHHGMLCLLFATGNSITEKPAYERRLSREIRSLYALHVHGNSCHPLLFERYTREHVLAAAERGETPPTRPLFYNDATLQSRLDHKNLPEKLLQTIRDDNVPTFDLLHTTLLGRKMSRSLCKVILANRAYKIIMSRPNHFEAVMPAEEILFYCVSALDESAVPLINFLEERHPGIVANARDNYGNNALWYGLHRLGSLRCLPKTEQALLSLGCDPDAPNCLDLTYRSMIEAQDFLNSL